MRQQEVQGLRLSEWGRLLLNADVQAKATLEERVATSLRQAGFPDAIRDKVRPMATHSWHPVNVCTNLRADARMLQTCACPHADLYVFSRWHTLHLDGVEHSGTACGSPAVVVSFCTAPRVGGDDDEVGLDGAVGGGDGR